MKQWLEGIIPKEHVTEQNTRSKKKKKKKSTANRKH